MNTQKPERRVAGDGYYLDVHSTFLTIQGEGPFTGHRAVFIRLAGCNLQCLQCDSLYTEGRREMAIGDVAARVAELYWLGPEQQAEGCLVVITGGEPLRQPIGRLVAKLLGVGCAVQIESNGVFPPDPVLRELLAARKVVLVVSPKTRGVHPLCHELANVFKYVVDHAHVDPDDGLPTMALGHERGNGVARPRLGAPVYLTPMDVPGEENWPVVQRNITAVVKACIEHGYVAGIQLHKYFGMA